MAVIYGMAIRKGEIAMKELIKLLLMGIYDFTLLEAGKLTLARVQIMALEKVSQGLGNLENIAQTMAGENWIFN